LEIIY